MKFKSLAIVFFSFSLIATLTQAKMICPITPNDVAWSFNKTKAALFNADITEPRNFGLSTEEKVQNVLKHVKKYPGKKPLNNEDMASLLVWTAECTGHDYTYLAGLIEHESDYCSMRKNRAGSGATGCGQFTASAVKVFKNQLRLPGQQTNNNASKLAKNSMEKMIKSCFPRNPSRAQDFINVFKGSTSKVKSALLNNVDMDVLATAIYLKFLVALKGGYIIPGSGPGALASYGDANESHYYSRVNKFAQDINYICYESHYPEEIERLSCKLSGEPEKTCVHKSTEAEIVEI